MPHAVHGAVGSFDTLGLEASAEQPKAQLLNADEFLSYKYLRYYRQQGEKR